MLAFVDVKSYNGCQISLAQDTNKQNMMIDTEIQQKWQIDSLSPLATKFKWSTYVHIQLLI